ncbi:MAG: NIPSNAP family protein [Burkholderiales bacterium]|nr:NIPSNAP family protein [Burkholderiales bacterium]
MTCTAPEHDHAHDFDFLLGRWVGHNRRLSAIFQGATTWQEFESTNVMTPMLDGHGNRDEYRSTEPAIVGATLRFYDPATQLWHVYWSNARLGRVEPPAVGRFCGNTGVFEGDDTFDGKPIRARLTWTKVDTANPRWEQAFSADGGKTWETNWTGDLRRPSEATALPGLSDDYQVFELRRYTLQPGVRDRFVANFEKHFPDAFLQLGAMLVGQFADRASPDTFVWLRGFHTLEARAVGNASFYYGQVWGEQRGVMNSWLDDHTNVLLLHPLPGTGVRILPPVGNAEGDRAGGIVVAQIIRAEPSVLPQLTQTAQKLFTSYQQEGVQVIGTFATLDVTNNFPQLPVRTDGPYLVWLAVVRDAATLAAVTQRAKAGAQMLADGQGLKAAPEWLVLDPTAQSRARWWEPPAK